MTLAPPPSALRSHTSEGAPRLSPASTGPVGSTPEATVSMGLVRALLDALARQGVSRADVLDRAGLEPQRVDTPAARASRAELYRVTELALSLTNDPALGLRWAENVTDRTFAPLSHVIAHASSLRRGFELLAEFYPLLSDQVSYQVSETEEQVVLRAPLPVGASEPVQRLTAELTLAGFWGFVRSFHPSASPIAVSFEYAAPAHRHEYSRWFNGKERFDQGETGIIFDRALLDLTSRYRDDEILEVMQKVAEQQLHQLVSGTPFAVRVRNHMAERATTERADMQSVARAMGLSERSLRRRLSAEETSFEALHTEAQGAAAKHLLAHQGRSIQEAAHEMGFSDASTFHRAFKRWTGMTPGAFIAFEASDRQAHIGRALSSKANALAATGNCVVRASVHIVAPFTTRVEVSREVVPFPAPRDRRWSSCSPQSGCNEEAIRRRWKHRVDSGMVVRMVPRSRRLGPL
jgi:AraC-like DNA-binding protein